MDAPAQNRGIIGRLLRYMLTPLYYWLDLYGPDGKPAHNKVKTTLVLLIVTLVTFRLALHVFGDLDTDPHAGIELTALTALCIFITCASYGIAGLRIWAETKGAPPPANGSSSPVATAPPLGGAPPVGSAKP